jgi:hypothetical protein
VLFYSVVGASAGLFVHEMPFAFIVAFMMGASYSPVSINPYVILESFIVSTASEAGVGDEEEGGGRGRGTGAQEEQAVNETMEDDTDVEELRGILTAMFNLCLTVGQVVMACTAGLFIAFFDGQIWPVLTFPALVAASVSFCFLLRSKALKEDEKEADRMITREGMMRLKLMEAGVNVHSLIGRAHRQHKPGEVLVDEGSDDDELQYEYFKRLYPQRRTRNRLESKRLLRIKSMLHAARPDRPRRANAAEPAELGSNVWETKYQEYREYSGTSDSDYHEQEQARMLHASQRPRSNSVDPMEQRSRRRKTAEKRLGKARKEAYVRQNQFVANARVPTRMVRTLSQRKKKSEGQASEHTPLLARR